MANAKVYKYDRKDEKMKFAGMRKRGASEINIAIDTGKFTDGPLIEKAVEARYEQGKPKFRYSKQAKKL